MHKLSGKVAIVTGGARGICQATAMLLSQNGARVVVVDLDGAEAVAAAKDIQARTGVDTLGLAANVSSLEQCQRVVQLVMEKWGRVDILVNSAGITKDTLLLKMSEADWDLVLDVNLKGSFNFTKAVTHPMIKARAGAIVNIASVVGQQGNAGQVNYCASKGGVIAMTKACAKELGSRNVRVNAISPGFIETRMTDVLPERVKTTLVQNVPLGRIGQPNEVAQAILFLVGDDASYISGAILNVNGGLA